MLCNAPTNLLESWRAMNAVTRLNSWAKREQDGWMDGWQGVN